jgi:hypothetical protein
MKKHTLTALKKHLSHKTKDELIHDIETLYQTFPQVKDYYQAQRAEMDDLVRKYKDIIQREFIEGKTRGLPRARFSVARKAINDLKKLTDRPEVIADVMLTYVESISWFNAEYSPDAEECYERPVAMFATVLGLLKTYALLEEFAPRVHQIVQNADDGWGYRDGLEGEYASVYGEFVE